MLGVAPRTGREVTGDAGRAAAQPGRGKMRRGGDGDNGATGKRRRETAGCGLRFRKPVDMR